MTRAPITATTDAQYWRCRFVPTEKNLPMTQAKLIELLTLLPQAHLDVIKTENRYTFHGKAGYSLGQGE